MPTIRGSDRAGENLTSAHEPQEDGFVRRRLTMGTQRAAGSGPLVALSNLAAGIRRSLGGARVKPRPTFGPGQTDATATLRDITDISEDELEMVKNLGVTRDIEFAVRDIIDGHSVEDAISRHDLPRFRDMRSILDAVRQRDLDERAVCAVMYGDMDEPTASAGYGIDGDRLKMLLSRQRNLPLPDATISVAFKKAQSAVDNGAPASLAIRNFDVQSPDLRRNLLYLERRVALNKISAIMCADNVSVPQLAHEYGVIHPAEIAELKRLLRLSR